MKKSSTFLLLIVLVAVIAFGVVKFIVVPSESGPSGLAMISASFPTATSSIGSATTYGVLASTYTDTSAATTVNGDVGFTTGHRHRRHAYELRIRGAVFRRGI